MLPNLPNDQTSSKDDEERYSHGDEQRTTEPENPRKKRRIAGVSELEHREGETMNWPIWLKDIRRYDYVGYKFHIDITITCMYLKLW